MSTSNSNTYLDLLADNNGSGSLASINTWWSPTEPDRVHLVIADSRFTDLNHDKPGLRLVFSSNPKSADYNPAAFNRVVRALRALNLPAPDEDAPEHKRHLRYRDAVTATVLGTSGPKTSTPQAGPVPPPDAEVCPTCFSYVADLAMHQGSMLH